MTSAYAPTWLLSARPNVERCVATPITSAWSHVCIGTLMADREPTTAAWTMTTGSQSPPTSMLDGPLNVALSRVTYRPDWQLWVTGDSWARWSVQAPRWLHVRARVEDSNDPGVDLLLDHSFPIPNGIQDEHEFYPWLAECLIAVERHESREFFKVDGKRFLDPHREENTRLYA